MSIVFKQYWDDPKPVTCKEVHEIPTDTGMRYITTAEMFTDALMPTLMECLDEETARMVFSELVRKFYRERMFVGRTRWDSAVRNEEGVINHYYRYALHVSYPDVYREAHQDICIDDRVYHQLREDHSKIKRGVVRHVTDKVFDDIEEYNNERDKTDTKR